MAFTHLHVHTGYSLLDGAGKIPEMVKRAKALGQDSMAITDHGVMYGAVEFFVECIKQGVKPIIGCEIYMTENNILDRVNTEIRYHLILLCKDKEGYHNLVKLVSKSFIDGYYYKPRVDYETLAKYSKGLVCMSACLQGEVAYNLLKDNYSEARKVARRLQDIFGKDDFYVEIQNHGLRDELRIHTDLIKLAREIDAKLIATNDVHYTLKEDEEAHDCLLCLQTGHKVSDENRMRYDGGQYYIKSEDEMRENFKFCTEAIDNTVEVVDKCNVHMDFTKASYGDITGKVKKAIEDGKVPKEKESLIELVDKCEYNVPKFKVPDGYDNVSYLKKLVMDGLNKRFIDPSKDLIDRVEFELKTIIDMGFVDYFLLVWDYIHYAKTHDIPVGPGRGSGVGSLVAYALEITDTNPIEYKLFFERFLNPERVSMPDIDTDFEVEKRQDVINYVREKYNTENVAQIVTFGTMGAKGSIRDVGRVLDIPLSKCNQAAKLIPQMLPKSSDFKKEVHTDFEKVLIGDIDAYRPADQSNIMEFRSLYESDDDIKHIVDIASRLEGLPRSAGTHASGVLIAPEPVYNFVPLARGKDESLVTQYTMIELEEVGMLKMDFLGLRNLSCIDECVKNIKKKYDKNFDLDKIPYDDLNVYKMISDGDTLGIFQLESAGMTNFMKNLGPTCIEDLIAGISLFRPGPMDSIPKYVDSKKNKDHIAYDCPQLMKVLDSTYGCIVYQEQVMEIFRELAGFSLGRADEVRRAMSKKKKEKMMAEEKNFIYGNPELNIDGCIKRGIDKTVAKKIFDEMSSFAEYAFNKSHAAAYARLAYQTAYLKYYYKVEFFSSICNSAISNRDLLSEYVSNIQINGIKILPCDINKSSIGFTVDGDDIRLGMAAIKGVGGGVASAIVEEREEDGPYTDFTSCLRRICKSKKRTVANHAVVESLLRVGAFDSFIGNRNQKMYMMVKILDDMDLEEKKKKKLLPGEKSFFEYMENLEREENGDTDTIDVQKEDKKYLKEYEDVADFDEESKLLTEKEYTGIYITGHPLNSYKDYIDDFANHKLSDFYPKDDYDESYLQYDGEKVRVVGVIDDFKKMLTKKGEQYARCTFSDQTDSIDCVIFPKTYRQAEPFLFVNNIVLMEGKIQYELDRDITNLLVEKVSAIDRYYDKKDRNRTLYLRFKNVDDYKEKILDINNNLKEHMGGMKVAVYIDDTKQVKMLPDIKVKASDELLAYLSDVLGKDSVVVKDDKVKQ